VRCRLFVLLVGLQLNTRAATISPPPEIQSWLTGDEAVNDHIWHQVDTLQGGATYVTAKLANGFSLKELAFADRVAYQRAIEEVYWRHRIWPKERHDPKPSLEEVMSQATIEQKVEDYLRDSELLEEEWQKPITSEQLQAEIERMAQHTKGPEVLRELLPRSATIPLLSPSVWPGRCFHSVCSSLRLNPAKNRWSPGAPPHKTKC